MKLAAILAIGITSMFDVGAQAIAPELLAVAESEIPVTVNLEGWDPIPREQWARSPRDLEGRARVVAKLKALAAVQQRDVLDFLEREGKAFVKEGSIRSHWICNTVGFTLVRHRRGAQPQANGELKRFLQALASLPGVKLVYWDAHPFPFISQCGGADHAACPSIDDGLPEAQGRGDGGSGVVVAIVDSGIEIDHPDLKGGIFTHPGEEGGKDGVDDDGNGYSDDLHGYRFAPTRGPIISDERGHGTNVGGVILGGLSGGLTGVAPKASIMPLRILGDHEWSEQAAWEAIEYAVENRAHVINLSLALDFPNRAGWRQAIEDAEAAGVPTVAGAGNEGACLSGNCIRSPGDVPSAITVGATNGCDVLWEHSSRGPVSWAKVCEFDGQPESLTKPEIVAPGVDVCTTCRGSSHCSRTGTSLSAPYVAGVLALMIHANPSLGIAGLRSCLLQTATPLGAEQPNNQTGNGLVDPLAAVRCAEGVP